MPTYAALGANYAGIAKNFSQKRPTFDLAKRFSEDAMTEPALFKNIVFSATTDPLKAQSDTARPDSWRDYDKLYPALPTPEVTALVENIDTLGDAVAWQRIAGCNPMVIAQCTRLPDAFPVTEAIYQRAMADGDTLEAARAEGRLFLADYGALDGVACGKTNGMQKYLAAPFALYALDRSTRKLRSVCIQNGQDPSVYAIVTADDGWHWRMATACVQTADANHHQGFSHLGRTHLVMEAVVIAMKRELAPNHPIAVLLEPHTANTMAINGSAKSSLIAPGGTVDVAFSAKISTFCTLVEAAIQSYPLETATPHDDLAARGLLDTDLFPEHPYRDDALPVWDAIEAYMGEYIALYYDADATVRGDTELQAFLRTLAAPEGGRIPGVPTVHTVEALHRLLTTLVFMATAQHSAVNFPQYHYMGYLPNQAGALFAPVPDRDTPNTEEAYAELIAPLKVAVESVTIAYLLANVRESRLGGYAPSHFADKRVLPIVARFNASLAKIEVATTLRDRGRYLSYPYLRPSQILQSISI